MKKKWRILIYVATILILIFVLWITFLWKIFSSGIAGSYPHAETWTFKVNEHKFLQIVEGIVREHPELMENSMNAHIEQRQGDYHHVVFFYTDTQENVQTWFRAENDTSYTTFALVAVSKKFDSSNAKDNFSIERKQINQDFNYFENRAQIKKFETKILKLIEEKLPK